MNIKSTFTKFLTLSLFAGLMTSCTTDESELFQDNTKSFDLEVTTENQGKVNDSLPGDNEPIIIRPRK